MLKEIIKQELISEEEYNLLLDAKPQTPELIPIAYSERAGVFKLVADENIEYRYINGSCEDRAHFISLLLSANGITAGKMWSFAPARYTFLSDELFNIADPYEINQDLTWGYHVAAYVHAYDKSGEVETLIIDQSFNPNGFLTLDEWLKMMDCPRAIQLTTDMHSYLFNSVFGYYGYTPVSYETHYNTPLDIPSVINGNFWYMYDGDEYVQRGLSVSDLAIEIYNLLQFLPEEEAAYFENVLTSIDEVIRFTAMAKPDFINQHTYDHFMSFYQKRYQHWTRRINELLG
ncbi:MAG: protein-glutamine glutaminase family protein [Cyclobacteriaceae bacterium]